MNAQFNCNVINCNAKFDKALELRGHLASVHLNWLPYRCSICPGHYGSTENHIFKHFEIRHSRFWNITTRTPFCHMEYNPENIQNLDYMFELCTNAGPACEMSEKNANENSEVATMSEVKSGITKSEDVEKNSEPIVINRCPNIDSSDDTRLSQEIVNDNRQDNKTLAICEEEKTYEDPVSSSTDIIKTEQPNQIADHTFLIQQMPNEADKSSLEQGVMMGKCPTSNGPDKHGEILLLLIPHGEIMGNSSGDKTESKRMITEEKKRASNKLSSERRALLRSREPAEERQKRLRDQRERSALYRRRGRGTFEIHLNCPFCATRRKSVGDYNRHLKEKHKQLSGRQLNELKKQASQKRKDAINAAKNSKAIVINGCSKIANNSFDDGRVKQETVNYNQINKTVVICEEEKTIEDPASVSRDIVKLEEPDLDNTDIGSMPKSSIDEQIAKIQKQMPKKAHKSLWALNKCPKKPTKVCGPKKAQKRGRKGKRTGTDKQGEMIGNSGENKVGYGQKQVAGISRKLRKLTDNDSKSTGENVAEKQGYIPCEVCSKVMANTPSCLDEHIWRQHMSRKRYSCSNCQQSFVETNSVKNHVQSGICLPLSGRCLPLSGQKTTKTIDIIDDFEELKNDYYEKLFDCFGISKKVKRKVGITNRISRAKV